MGVRYLFLSLAVGLAAVNTGNNLLYLLFAMMLSLIIVAGIFSERSLARLTVTRTIPPRLFAGAKAAYRVTVTNRKRLMPAFSLRVREDTEHVPIESPTIRCRSLNAGDTATFDTDITFLTRGSHRLSALTVTTTFPFGLFEKTLRLPLRTSVLVYPALGALLQRPIGSGHDSLGRGTVRGSAGFSHVRDYHMGDDPRYIHWKHSARRAKLVVREPEPESARTAVLILSNRLPSDPLPIHLNWFESAVRMAASAVDRSVRNGREVVLATGDGVSRVGRGSAQLERLLRSLAIIAPSTGSQGERLVSWTASLATPPTLLILPWEDPSWNRVRSRSQHLWIASRHEGDPPS